MITKKDRILLEEYKKFIKTKKLTEGLEISIITLIQYFEDRINNNINKLSFNNFYDGAAKILYIIALVTKNKPSTLRNLYSIVGGFMFGFMLPEAISGISSDSSFLSSPSEKNTIKKKNIELESNKLFLLHIFITILLSILPNALAKIFVPTKTDNLKKRMYKKTKYYASMFNLSLIVGIISFKIYESMMIKQGYDVVKVKKGTINKLLNYFLLFKYIAFSIETITSEMHQSNEKERIVKDIKKIAKRGVDYYKNSSPDFDVITGEKENKKMFSIQYANSSSEIIKKKSDTNIKDVIDIMVKHFGIPKKDITVVGCYNKNEMIINSGFIEKDHKNHSFNQEFCNQIIDSISDIRIKVKKNSGFDMDNFIYKGIHIMSINVSKNSEIVTLLGENAVNGRLLNAFSTNNSVTLMFMEIENRQKDQSILNNFKFNIEVIIGHEIGHEIMANNYFSFISSNLLSYILLTSIYSKEFSTDVPITENGKKLLISALSYLGYNASVHSELEADAFAAEILGLDKQIDLVNIFKSIMPKGININGYIDDPHGRLLIRAEALKKYIKENR